jgi:hypothetical protein
MPKKEIYPLQKIVHNFGHFDHFFSSRAVAEVPLKPIVVVVSYPSMNYQRFPCVGTKGRRERERERERERKKECSPGSEK